MIKNMYYKMKYLMDLSIVIMDLKCSLDLLKYFFLFLIVRNSIYFNMFFERLYEMINIKYIWYFEDIFKYFKCLNVVSKNIYMYEERII